MLLPELVYADKFEFINPKMEVSFFFFVTITFNAL